MRSGILAELRTWGCSQCWIFQAWDNWMCHELAHTRVLVHLHILWWKSLLACHLLSSHPVRLYTKPWSSQNFSRSLVPFPVKWKGAGQRACKLGIKQWKTWVSTEITGKDISLCCWSRLIPSRNSLAGSVRSRLALDKEGLCLLTQVELHDWTFWCSHPTSVLLVQPFHPPYIRDFQLIPQ